MELVMEKCTISLKYIKNIRKTKLESIRYEPWTHFVLDDFIDSKQFKLAQSEILAKKYDFNIMEEDRNKIRYTLLTYMPLARLFYSLEFKNLVSRITSQELWINESNMVQLRKADNKTPYFPRHVDVSPLGRTLVVIYCLSPSWSPKHGGRLCLHKSRNSPSSESIFVEPKENRLVAFFTDKESWHSVEKVRGWERYSVLSEWICS
jgi:Rps23 Pro-64 3,4-dihydroxylase Tpa1-like proline 4-hydroxylase